MWNALARSLSLSLYLSLSLSLTVSLFSLCLSLCLSIYLSVSLSVYLSLCLSLCLFISLSLCVSVDLSLCLSLGRASHARRRRTSPDLTSDSSDSSIHCVTRKSWFSSSAERCPSVAASDCAFRSIRSQSTASPRA